MAVTEMVESFPLYWPDGWKRTPSYARKFGKFKTGFAAGRDELMCELKRLGAQDVILSTNIPLRRDGLPYADFKAPQDTGVAVYFTYKKQPMCFACDQFNMVQNNINAIRHTVEALRGIERWGASDMLERAFRGFAALPAASAFDWKNVLGFTAEQVRQGTISREQIESAFRERAKTAHADAGGDDEQMRRLLAAREQARAEVRG